MAYATTLNWLTAIRGRPELLAGNDLQTVQTMRHFAIDWLAAYRTALAGFAGHAEVEETWISINKDTVTELEETVRTLDRWLVAHGDHHDAA